MEGTRARRRFGHAGTRARGHANSDGTRARRARHLTDSSKNRYFYLHLTDKGRTTLVPKMEFLVFIVNFGRQRLSRLCGSLK